MSSLLLARYFAMPVNNRQYAYWRPSVSVHTVLLLSMPNMRD